MITELPPLDGQGAALPPLDGQGGEGGALPPLDGQPGGHLGGQGAGHAAPAALRRRRPSWLLPDLERPGDVFRDLGPNWFASVMGTGIVAIAAGTLPFRITGLHVFALVVWALAAAWLVVLAAGWAVHWTRYPSRARAHAENPVMAQFWGAPPMALLTVGAGTLLVGKDWTGAAVAVDADWVLWSLGTALGLVTACWIPYLMMTRHEIAPDGAFGGWLMPVVPPMVSAATGALLVPYAAAGQARLTLLTGCYAMFGISLFASVIVITLLWGRLVTHKTLPAVLVPTLWIVLGPLGQSVTAAGNLAKVAGLTLHAPYAAGADVFALLYGVPAWGFAMAWLAIAACVTLRAVRQGMPFGLTWWSFTFPVGTCVTGTIGLAARTGADLLRYGAAGLFLLLLAAWLIVAVRTLRDGARGRLFLPAGTLPAGTAQPEPAAAQLAPLAGATGQ
jgi:C4-dicarboxylate transporter/malic acid transport protein